MSYHNIHRPGPLQRTISDNGDIDSQRAPATPTSKGQDITLYASLLTLPLLLLTGALFAMVFGFQVKPNDVPFSELAGNDSASIDNGAFYVNLPSTLLIFVSSWMSSLAPVLTGFAVALAVYPISDGLFTDTTRSRSDRLPTPYQLSIFLKLISGSIWVALMDLMNYRTTWQKRQNAQGRALVQLTRLTVFVVAMSFVVLGADTWLHIVTKTVPFVQLTAVPATDARYSLSLLSPNCTTTDNSISQLAINNLTCTIDPALVRLQNGVTAIQTLNDRSNKMNIYNNGPDPSLVYLGVAPTLRDDQRDFTATTVGMRAKCRAVTQECGLGGKANASNFYAFDCANESFKGQLIGLSSGSGFLYQSYYFDFDAGNTSDASTLNPYQYAVAFATQISENLETRIEDDPGVAISNTGDFLAAVLLCDVTAYDIEYDMVNGNVSRMVTTPSNTTTVNVFTPGLMQTVYGWSALQSALQVAAVTATNVQDLADQYAIAYSKVALSIGAGSFVRSPVVRAQRRDTILVAKVPKAPLLLLVVTDLIFVCLGVILTIRAIRTSHHAFHIQARLGIAGIVADLFGGSKARRPAESQERLFDEYWESNGTDRIGVQRTQEGGYILRPVEQQMMGGKYLADL